MLFSYLTTLSNILKKLTAMIKYVSLIAFILVLTGAIIKTNGDATSIIVVLITALLFAVASIKSKDLQKK